MRYFIKKENEKIKKLKIEQNTKCLWKCKNLI